FVFLMVHRATSGSDPAHPEKPPAEPADHSHSAEARPGAPTVPTAEPVQGATGTLKFAVVCDGRPVKDAKIIVQRQGTPDFMTFGTEPDGTQLLRGLPVGEFAIRTEHPDLIPASEEVRVEPEKTT